MVDGIFIKMFNWDEWFKSIIEKYPEKLDIVRKNSETYATIKKSYAPEYVEKEMLHCDWDQKTAWLRSYKYKREYPLDTDQDMQKVVIQAIEACKVGDIETIRQLMEHKAVLSMKCIQRSCFGWACYYGHKTVAEELHQRFSFDKNVVTMIYEMKMYDSRNGTLTKTQKLSDLFSITCFEGYASLALWLLKTFDLKKMDIIGNQNECLRAACRHGNLELVKEICVACDYRDLKSDTREIQQALSSALKKSNLHVADWLVKEFEIQAPLTYIKPHGFNEMEDTLPIEAATSERSKEWLHSFNFHHFDDIIKDIPCPWNSYNDFDFVRARSVSDDKLVYVCFSDKEPPSTHLDLPVVWKKNEMTMTEPSFKEANFDLDAEDYQNTTADLFDNHIWAICAFRACDMNDKPIIVINAKCTDYYPDGEKPLPKELEIGETVFPTMIMNHNVCNFICAC
jgi:hypothetical protein